MNAPVLRSLLRSVVFASGKNNEDECWQAPTILGRSDRCLCCFFLPWKKMNQLRKMCRNHRILHARDRCPGMTWRYLFRRECMPDYPLIVCCGLHWGGTNREVTGSIFEANDEIARKLRSWHRNGMVDRNGMVEVLCWSHFCFTWSRSPAHIFLYWLEHIDASCRLCQLGAWACWARGRSSTWFLFFDTLLLSFVELANFWMCQGTCTA